MRLKSIKKKVGKVLALNDTPERIALAFAIGVFISFSPLLGLHTVIGMLLAVLFGLNRMAVLTGVWFNNPWTLIPVYSAAHYIGSKLIGFPQMSLPRFHLHELWRSEYWLELIRGWPILKPLILGSTILAVICSTLCYAIVLMWLRRARTPSNRSAQ